MEEIVFEVQGSTSKPYRISFIRHSIARLSAYCTCPAGENGQHCKHRLRIMDGEQIDIVSNNGNDVLIIQNWLIGTDVEKALHELRKIEKEAEKIKKELSLARKKLAKIMYD